MRRREFISLLGGATAWSFAARAQQTDRVRRVGVLMTGDENDSFVRHYFSEFKRGLAEFGWIDGRNLQMDVRWVVPENFDRMRMIAQELVGLKPDVIQAGSTPATAALQRSTRRIPIVFAGVSDPVGEGFIASLARPGGNLTGFINLEASIGGKWVELLKEVAPAIERVAAIFNPDTAPRGGSYFLPPFEAAARALKMEPLTALVHSDADIEATLASLGREKGGLVVMPDNFVFDRRALIISVAGRNNIPTVHQFAVFAREGGLFSYGANTADIYYRAASYVDRILRGAAPAELPAQVPTKFAMAVNVKTANKLGLEIPPTLLVLANEVIE
jgi:putative ABC transport system substrate-binding protein